VRSARKIQSMDRIQELISEAVAKLPADLIPQMVIFGSASIASAGVSLGRSVKDLDLFVSDDTFDELRRRGFHVRVKLRDKETGDDVLHIVVAGAESDPDVEILKTFQGVEFSEVFSHSHIHASGFRMSALDDARRWKVASGRPKDLNDVASIDRHLNR
jgi:hypothetical protein